jgi:shikimate kinase
MGFMASGKSTIGRMLADKLDLNFIDLDVFIEGNEGQTISSIFETKGEAYFRELEAKSLNLIVSMHTNLVLALGGGSPCHERNWESINQTKAVYLYKTNEQLFERLKTRKHKRPLIAGMTDETLDNFIVKRMEERAPFYERADYTVQVLDSKKETVKVIAYLVG